jgi:photosystem II stability/assembly factor-like uncharacterized protein
MGFKPDFDILTINRGMKYSLFRNDTLLSTGVIEIIDQTSDKLRVEFLPRNDRDILTGYKNVSLGQDTLLLNDDCCDQFSYFFVRSEIFSSENFQQINKELDFVNVTNYPIGYNKNFTSVYFKNENLGFITCYDGSILKTSNGGENWILTITNNSLPLRDIAFINENVGYAVGGESSCGGSGCVVPGYVILKSVNGGESWDKVSLPHNNHEFSLIRFINENVGIAIGTGIYLKTVDGGLTWRNINIDNLMFVYELYFLNEDVGYISGIKGKFFKTTNGGETWQDMSLNTDYQLYTVMFLNEQVGFIGKFNNLIKTTDGGLTWNSIDYAPVGVQKMFFISENDGVVFGSKTYVSSKWDVWDSCFNILINGKWFGDQRVKSHSIPFCLNSSKYYTITAENEISIITTDN